MNAHDLRKQLRQQRLRLSKRHRNRAAYQARRSLNRLQHPALTGRNVKIGIFADAFGEMPTQPLMDWARQRGYSIYLPVVTGHNQPLVFIQFIQKTWRQSRLPRHPLGMRQPAMGKSLKASQLDVLIMPLVAADKQGNRMGMGGGYYDRTLAKAKSKPLKIGWAYDFQLVEKLNANPWDITLDALITPSKLWLFRRYLVSKQ
jgi:5-formyltetrahydrofolate cyclo-ligase